MTALGNSSDREVLANALQALERTKAGASIATALRQKGAQQGYVAFTSANPKFDFSPSVAPSLVLCHSSWYNKRDAELRKFEAMRGPELVVM